MTSAIEHLKAFARAAAAPLSSLDRRLLAETGLPVVWDAMPDPIHAALTAELLPLSDADDLAGLAAAFDRMFAEKKFCGHGYRTYRVAQELMLSRNDVATTAADPLIAEKSLAPYADWWQRDRTDPAAAAIYARALTATGYAWRGAGWADSVDPASWDKLRDYCGHARSVLAHAGPRGRRHCSGARPASR